MDAVYNGRFEHASNILIQSEEMVPNRDILLYYLNRGSIYWMKGDLDSSNTYFQKADFYIEDFRKNYAAQALSLVSNPKVVPYGGEGFEQIMLHYYTTLNYAQKGDLDAALVECKRMMLKLTKITDYYNGNNKYKRDAFAHNLLGMIYDAQGDYNNAFIAYRNALEIYEDDYKRMLDMSTPEQLKLDIIRTANLTGFYEEQQHFEKKFNLSYTPDSSANGTLLFFWNNGLGPIKQERSITFAIFPSGDGYVRFVNVELGIEIPFYVGDEKQTNSLADMRFIRVAFPKYMSRVPLFQSAVGSIDSLNKTYEFNMGENIDAIAYRSLQDRMLKELGEALLRLAIKQVAAEQARKENEGLGMALSVFNAITEQADTRNWQFLPYSINYIRMSVPEGNHQFKLTTKSKSGNETTAFTYQIKRKQTTFATFQSLQFIGYR